MDVVWSADESLTVREVLDRMPSERHLAYTTVMTVMTNLARKGLLERAPAGRAYSYRALLSREEAAAASLREILNASDNPESVLLHFAQTASDQESDVLRDALARRNERR
jgi:predicted transcriptional regulator